MDINEQRLNAKRMRPAFDFETEGPSEGAGRFGRMLSFSAADPPAVAAAFAVPRNVQRVQNDSEGKGPTFSSPLSVLIPNIGTPTTGPGSPGTPQTPWDCIINGEAAGCPPTPVRNSTSEGKYKAQLQAQVDALDFQAQVDAFEFDQDCRLDRASSLDQTKVLVCTSLKRTKSILQPSLFAFDEHFDFTRIIGRSQQSEVYEARSRTDGSLTAVKRSVRPLLSYADRTRHMHEVDVFQGLGEHENIVKYYRCWQQEGFFYVQLELCEGGSLREVLDIQRQLPESILWRVVREIASGLNYLHSRRILHLDIKPDNVFLNAMGTFKIGDFGLAVVDSQWDWEDGDGKYVAPELLKDDTQPTAAADIYSFGVMLYECLVGEFFPRSPARAGKIDFPPGAPPALCNLIQRMLANDPAARPSAEEVLNVDAEMNPEAARIQAMRNACTPTS